MCKICRSFIIAFDNYQFGNYPEANFNFPWFLLCSLLNFQLCISFISFIVFCSFHLSFALKSTNYPIVRYSIRVVAARDFNVNVFKHFLAFHSNIRNSDLLFFHISTPNPAKLSLLNFDISLKIPYSWERVRAFRVDSKRLAILCVSAFCHFCHGFTGVFQISRRTRVLVWQTQTIARYSTIQQRKLKI